MVITFGKCLKSGREKFYSKLGEEKIFKKPNLTTPDKIEKYAELIEKTPEAKIMMQSSSSDNCAHNHNIKILNYS